MKLLRRIQFWLHHKREEDDLAAELAFHQAMLRQGLENSGDSSAEAALTARRAMGNTTLMREDSRAVWMWPWLQSIWRDLVYAVRAFRRQPGFTLVAVVALAFAIGLNTSLFTIFNAVALRPWAVPEPGRVASVFRYEKNPAKGMDKVQGLSLGEVRYLSENSKSMSGIFITRGEGGLHLEGSKVRAEYASHRIFDVLRLRMERGRGFLADEDRAESPQAVAVLSYNAWQSRFAGDPTILSRRVLLDGVPFTIVGVAPRGFWGVDPERTDLWVPVSSIVLLHPNDAWAPAFLRDPQSCCYNAGGRLSPGVTREQAQAELSVLSVAYNAQFHQRSDGMILAGTPLLQHPGQKSQEISNVFALMFAAVTLVLLLACANVGNLLLARAVARRKEIGVRLSLGAGRVRVVRQLLTESLALACLAGAIGISVAFVVPGPLMRAAIGEAGFSLAPDLTVLAYTLGLAVLACLAFGLAPALHATRGNISETMKDRHAGGTRLTLRSTLLAIQVAISVILLVGAGLLTRGIQHVYTKDPGFAVEGNVVVSFDFPTTTYSNARMAAFFHDLSQGLDANPGASPYGLAVFEPLSNSKRFTGFHLPGQTSRDTKLILLNHVSSGYFVVLRIPVVDGRNFQPTDADAGAVIVNQAMADRYFPGESAVGKSILTDKPHTIVGVVRNAYLWGLDKIDPMMFSSIPYNEPVNVILHNTPANLAAVESLGKGLDPQLKMQVTSLGAGLDRWLSASRIGAWVAAMMGVLALVLAAIGVSGVFAYAVQQRTQEIGIRLALGARPAQVTQVVLGWAARSLAIGVAAGVVGAILASRALGQYLFGVSSLDPVTYTAVFLTLILAGLGAAYLPARRAMKLDPVRALRCD